ncbi:MAG: 4-diphosphocytidyl-2-C-methyl-D-erythritol kinase [Phycisphaerales bacterium]|nr:MAG: 4-diphosphocytidyl-2-C-methyl-D-erythritol kinase [Phycisphaerales bacterium]
MHATTLRAWAKVNLALAVAPAEHAGPRLGWHRICSWMHAIELHDTVRIEPVPGDPRPACPTLRTRWADDAPLHAGQPVAWPADADLALRAARLLAPDAPLRITIDKRIPDGAGLGGGSSDAAAVLIGASAALGLPIRPDHLRRLAQRLGSDVAFFIDLHQAADPPGKADARTLGPTPTDAPPRPAIVEGFGQDVHRLPAPARPTPITLALPGFGCPTASVYRTFDADHPGPIRRHAVLDLARRTLQDPAVGPALFNDLQPPAERLYPALAELRRRLERAWNQPVHLTGSGSTLFALGHHQDVQGCTLVRTMLV